MAWLVLLLVLAILFGGLGFFVKALWWIAVIMFIVWLIGLATGRGRWY